MENGHVAYVSPQVLAEQNPTRFRLIQRGANAMFETAVLGKRTTLLWGAIMGVVALAVLLGAGYVLIA